jgi:riboflavin transporter FmnP
LAVLLLPVTFGAFTVAALTAGFSPHVDQTVIISIMAFVLMVAVNVALPLGIAFRWPEMRRRLKTIPMPILLFALGILAGAAIVVTRNGGISGYQLSVPGGM